MKWLCLIMLLAGIIVIILFKRLFGLGSYASVSLVIVLSAVLLFICAGLCSYELTVTDKRIYGKLTWGRQLDLPVDAVSAVAKYGWLLKGVSISTASGRIKFRVIKNADEIYDVIKNLLIERQQTRGTVVVPNAVSNDEADQLKKYKELLDSGAISQDEYEAKKKQLLGL